MTPSKVVGMTSARLMYLRLKKAHCHNHDITSLLPPTWLPYWIALADPASGDLLGCTSRLVEFRGHQAAFMNHAVTLVVLTLLAVIELIADKLPKTPARTAPLGLIARIVFACLCGVALATAAGGNLLVSAIVGIGGALIGTFVGYKTRHALVFRAHLPDPAMALVEDVIAVAGSLLIVSHV
jgi:uncharacterized membrane protein